MPPISIKTFYEEVASVEGEGREIVPAPPLPVLADERTPALERLIEWGKERNELTNLMSSAHAGSPNADYAMETLTRMFPVKNRTRRVRVPEELVEKHAGGNIHDLTFGVQDINSPEEWDHLEKRVERAHLVLALKREGEELGLEAPAHHIGKLRQ
jgi:hypothetical protein